MLSPLAVEDSNGMIITLAGSEERSEKKLNQLCFSSNTLKTDFNCRRAFLCEREWLLFSIIRQFIVTQESVELYFAIFIRHQTSGTGPPFALDEFQQLIIGRFVRDILPK